MLPIECGAGGRRSEKPGHLHRDEYRRLPGDHPALRVPEPKIEQVAGSRGRGSFRSLFFHRGFQGADIFS